MGWLLTFALPAACLAAVGAGYWALSAYLDAPSSVPFEPVFKDDARTNTQVSADQLDLSFLTCTRPERSNCTSG